MTRAPTFPELAVLTLSDPHRAAQTILGWHLPKEAIWTAIALVSVVITILSTLSNLVFPVPAPLSAIVGNPFMYFLIAAGGFIATVHVIYWTGRMLGGSGTIENLMVLFLWLQGLRAAAQVVVLIAMLIAPVLASFIVLFVAVATLWVFVHFISIGLHLNSIMRAVVVLFVGAAALIIGLGFLLSLIGVSAEGVLLNV
jgi:hypothetical protein